MTGDPCARPTRLWNAATVAESIRSAKERSWNFFRASLQDPRGMRNTQPTTAASFIEPSRLKNVRPPGACSRVVRHHGNGIANARRKLYFPCSEEAESGC